MFVSVGECVCACVRACVCVLIDYKPLLQVLPIPIGPKVKVQKRFLGVFIHTQ